MSEQKAPQKPAWTWLWLSLVVIAIDQFSKYLVNTTLPYNKPLVLLPFFNFTLRYNAGAAFGFLGSENGWQVLLLMAVTIIVVCGLIVWLVRTPRSDWLTASALTLILGGACGNLIDRIQLGYVVDFLDFHIGAWQFATFNLADTAICIGAFFLIIGMMFKRS